MCAPGRLGYIYEQVRVSYTMLASSIRAGGALLAPQEWWLHDENLEFPPERISRGTILYYAIGMTQADRALRSSVLVSIPKCYWVQV